ncbi:MAG: c-type cytochrome [Bryobacterales bacterium]|nr:c-type cytochrome [Bryobacteraceae bacterium]MDW8354558.1 c-type cytochrome [Bryobacterales bacterium]
MRTDWFVVLLLAARASGTIPIPGDARQGAEVFKAQGCIQCHSVAGQGGKLGPDLARRVGRGYTPSLMASLMWNHAPEMWSAMEKAGIAKPQLTTEQAADLFAYFYSARYFEQPGDAGRGKRLFESRRCAGCHGVTTALPGGARPVLEWASLADPIVLAAEMWNHAAQMKEAFAKRKIPWVRLTSQELADLLVYLQNLPETRGVPRGFAPASAETGAMLFRAKGCAGCHTGNNSLENRFPNRTMTDFAVAMWNHAPDMGPEAPTLRPEEMRRIVGYLWSLQVFDQRGDPRRGKLVYAAKQCASCHDYPASGAPRILGNQQLNSMSMVAALWKHGPAMLRQRQALGLAWPRFRGPEMADLLAYLTQP